MGCCIALAAVFAVLRRGWLALRGRSPAPAAHFAPPARRPTPGLDAVPPPRIRGNGPSSRGISTVPHYGFAVVGAGLAWFAIGVVGMHALGWFTWAEGSLLSDAAFHSSGLWLAAAGSAVLVVRS